MKILRTAALLLLSLCVLPVSVLGESGEDYTVSYEGITTGIVNARTAVHDPSIIAVDGRYYIFGSHMAAAYSDNLRGWNRMANGYQPDNPVWGNLFAEGSHVFDWAGSRSSVIPTDDGANHVWAPDVIWNPVMEKYMMYYCVSSTWNASALCFGLSDTIEGPYEWQATLICSGFDKNNISQSNVYETVDENWAKKYFTLAGGYDYNKWPNAIDPALFFDADNRLWMVYGSWSGGIFLLEIDPATGLVIHPEAADGVDPYFGRHLFGGNHQSMEGPYIQYDPEAGYYYLFVSYGALQTHGGYQIRVFRSESPEGPYLDMNGEQPNRRGGHANFGLKLSGNYMLPSVRNAYMATGHWPCLLPYSTREEAFTDDWAQADVTGRWFVINQGTAISDEIAEPVIHYLRDDGSVGAADGDAGTWSVEEGTHFLTLTLGDVTYSGVLCRMQDDGGNEVTAFSAVGANQSVWGVKYGE